MCSVLGSLFFFLPDSALYAQTNSYPLQVLTLGVQDRRGKFVEDIQLNQIVIKGLAGTVERFELDNAPRRILLLLDTSGSMGDRRTLSWSNVVQFTVRFALQRKGDNFIGLDTFAEKDQALVPFTTDSQSVVKQIEAFSNSGKGRTMLGLALTQILARGQDGLRFGDAIILITDGERSDADKTNFNRLRDELTRAGIRICMVRLPKIWERTAEAISASTFIKEIGGMEFDLMKPRDEIERELARCVRHHRDG